MRRNSFGDYQGRSPRFSRMVTMRKTRQLQRDDVTVVEVSVRFESFLFPEGFVSRSRKFIGRCRCSRDDVYDAALGLEIAEHKAMAKAYRYVYATFRDNALGFARVADACSRLAGRAWDKMERQVRCFRRKGGVVA